MKLSLTNTRLLGISYLAAIPIFALIYSTIPDHFVHGNLSKESAYDEVVDRIEEAVKGDFLLYVEDWNSGGEGKYYGRGSLEKYYTTYQDIEFSIVDVSEGVISINAAFSVVSHIPTLENLDDDPEDIESRTFTYIDQMLLVPFTPGGIPQNRNLGYYALMNKDFLGPYDAGSDELAHALNTSIAAEVEEVLLLQRGVSRQGLDNFSRMLYFSAVTMTTLGYGDIAPTSSFSRFLISSQVILGIILIGLFLSSVSPRDKS